ncbi:hypothetical protein HOH45_01165 [bacterium]|jgi:multidrug transporter EmrE-like cation transporter|nr:hypothetical protein [bacterium]
MWILVLIILVRTITDISFKFAVNNLNFDSINSVGSNIILMIKTPVLWLGLTMGIANYYLWILCLREFDLSYAYPFLSIAYISIILSGKFIFKERLGINKVIGLLFISLGAGMLFVG